MYELNLDLVYVVETIEYPDMEEYIYKDITNIIEYDLK